MHRDRVTGEKKVGVRRENRTGIYNQDNRKASRQAPEKNWGEHSLHLERG
jgi:hypothetical protein